MKRRRSNKWPMRSQCCSEKSCVAAAEPRPFLPVGGAGKTGGVRRQAPRGEVWRPSRSLPENPRPSPPRWVGQLNKTGLATNPSKTRSRLVRGVSIFERRVGSGPPVVVLHGGPGAHHDYLLPGFDALARRRELDR